MTRPLQFRDTTVTLRCTSVTLPLHFRYSRPTVTLPLHDRCTSVTLNRPLHLRSTSVKLPLHDRYTSNTPNPQTDSARYSPVHSHTAPGTPVIIGYCNVRCVVQIWSRKTRESGVNQTHSHREADPLYGNGGRLVETILGFGRQISTVTQVNRDSTFALRRSNLDVCLGGQRFCEGIDSHVSGGGTSSFPLTVGFRG